MTRQTGTLDGAEVAVLDLWEEQDAPEIVSSSLPEANPNWRYTDRQGHEHAPEVYTDSGGVERVRDWPTLAVVVEEVYWCEECSDEHERTHRACRICGEQIEPGSRTAVPLSIPGLRRIKARLSGGSYSREERTLVVGGVAYQGYTLSAEWASGEEPRIEFEGMPRDR
jgi:hypothetical protein